MLQSVFYHISTLPGRTYLITPIHAQKIRHTQTELYKCLQLLQIFFTHTSKKKGKGQNSFQLTDGEQKILNFNIEMY